MRERDFYIDCLRSVMIALVVLDHAAITYGASGLWFYHELSPSAALSSKILTLFSATNQAYFMGFLFLLAGYFTPGSLERKGYARFLGDRFLRLGFGPDSSAVGSIAHLAMDRSLTAAGSLQLMKVLLSKLKCRACAALHVSCLAVTQLHSPNFPRDGLRQIRKFDSSNAIERCQHSSDMPKNRKGRSRAKALHQTEELRMPWARRIGSDRAMELPHIRQRRGARSGRFQVQTG